MTKDSDDRLLRPGRDIGKTKTTSRHYPDALPEQFDAIDDTESRAQPALDAPSLAGQKLGNILVKAEIESGGCARVYSGFDERLKRTVAVKLLLNPLDVYHQRLFEQEAEAMAALEKEPNVVNIYGWGVHGDLNYLELEYVAQTARTLVDDSQDGLGVIRALEIVHDCAKGLEAAHALGIIHRDVKPSNILIEPGNGRAKLCDFGLSRYVAIPKDDGLAPISGTPPYMPPEQVKGMAVDERSDIYSLGVTLYELISNARPYDGANPDEVMRKIRKGQRVPLLERCPKLAPSIVAVVDKATAQRPEDRYRTAGEFARAVKGLLTELGQTGRIEEDAPPVVRQSTSRARIGLFVSAPVVLTLLGVFLVLQLLNWGGSSPRSQALAEANAVFDEGRLVQAQQLYERYLERVPEDDDALYGLGFALLRQNALDRAQSRFDAIEEPSLQAEGRAAVRYAYDGEQARTDIETAREVTSRRYPDALLGLIELRERRYADVVSRLADVTRDDFYFQWQFVNALKALGQAQFHLSRFIDAQQTFERAIDVEGAGAVTNAYLEMIAAKRDQGRREEVRNTAARIREMIDERVEDEPGVDPWTSRPLTFFVAEAQPVASPYALETGLAVVLPRMLANAIQQQGQMTLVERELIHEILAEQELSGLVGSRQGRLALGRVLGARLLVEGEFTTLAGEEKLWANVVDNETSEVLNVPAVPLARGVTPEQAVRGLSENVTRAVQAAYPIRARLYQNEGVAELNVGANVGVTDGLVFDVHLRPEAPPLRDVTVVVEGAPGAETTRVRLEGVELNGLPGNPETGLYVQSRPEPAEAPA